MRSEFVLQRAEVVTSEGDESGEIVDTLTMSGMHHVEVGCDRRRTDPSAKLLHLVKERFQLGIHARDGMGSRLLHDEQGVKTAG